MVQAFDQQILGCVEDESLSPTQQAELLAWTHDHLLSAYAAFALDVLALAAGKRQAKHRINACHSVVEIISNMLDGGIPLEAEDMTFHCPPLCCRRAQALSQRLPGWIRRRVVLAAQRTRWHTEAELTALWEAIEAHLITGAIAEFELADLLGVEVPDLKALETTTLGCLEAMNGAQGLSWEPMQAGCQQED